MAWQSSRHLMIAKQAHVIHTLRKEVLKRFHQSLFVETEEDFVMVWLLLMRP